MPEYIKKLRPFGDEWDPLEEIGAGSYGTVWKAVRRTGKAPEYTAIKEILIPGSEEVLREARLEGLDQEGAKLYFREILEKTKKEAAFMESFSSCPNIVRFYGYEVRERKDPGTFGWALYIQMELLTPVRKLLLEKQLSVREAGRMAADICRALECCREKNIVHRDIKPDNLFYDPEENIYKLGDFGFARQLSRATAGKGRPGTLSYMPPEVYQGAAASEHSDLYGTGMILYRLLNHFRIPLLPDHPAAFTPEDRDRALIDRLNGEEIRDPQIVREKGKPPAGAPGIFVEPGDEDMAMELGRIARKSIAADPAERFQSAKELRKKIEELIF